MRDLAGKTAFITGGASGIGLGMARVFARAGMNVVAADVRQDHIETARTEIAEAGMSEKVRFLQLDVTDRAMFREVADEAEAIWGRIDVLCNNAGIGLLTPIGEAGEADWDWAIEVNLNSLFNGVRAVLPKIRATGAGGHVVNTASMAGMLNYSRAGIYVTTKFAVVGFSEALRAELAPQGIGVSVFCPGGVRTNIRDYEGARPDRFAKEDDAAPSGPPPGFKYSEDDLKRLGTLSATPDQAGELVLQGIRDNALYIFTAPEFRAGIEQRFAAIRRAMGEDKEREAIALELIPGLVGSPIYDEAP